jgi:hypothetical protein
MSPLNALYGVLLATFVVWLAAIWYFAPDAERRRIFVTYLLLGTCLFFVRAARVRQHYDVLETVVDGRALAPNLYRVFVPALANGLKFALPWLSWVNAARVVNYTFILAALPLFHLYLRHWFSARASLAVTILLVCLMPMSFAYDYPDDFVELVVFIVGFWAIRDGEFR